MARPKKQIDANQVEQLASIGCSIAEIAAMLDCSRDTLERRFAANINKGKERLKISLRRMQYKSAQGGNVTMQIWLGKQYLEQREKSESIVTIKDYEIEIGVPVDTNKEKSNTEQYVN